MNLLREPQSELGSDDGALEKKVSTFLEGTELIISIYYIVKHQQSGY